MVYVMDFWVKALIFYFLFLIIVHSRDVAEVFEEMLIVERIAKKLRLLLLLCVIWRTFSCTYLLIPSLPLLKYLSCLRYDHHGILEFGVPLIGIVKFYKTQIIYLQAFWFLSWFIGRLVRSWSGIAFWDTKFIMKLFLNRWKPESPVSSSVRTLSHLSVLIGKSWKAVGTFAINWL